MITSENLIGAVIFYLGILLPLMVVLATISVLLFRRSIRGLMRQVSDFADQGVPPQTSPLRDLTIELITPSGSAGSILLRADAPGWIAVAIEFEGACAFGLTASLLLLSSIDDGFGVLPVILLTLSHAAPWLVIAQLISGPDRRRQAVLCGMFALVLLFFLVLLSANRQDAPATSAATWLSFMLGPALAIIPSLALLNRTLRTIWPVFLTATIVTSMTMVAIQFLIGIQQDVVTRILLNVAMAVGGGAWLAMLLIFLLGLIPGLVLSWIALRSISAHHEGRRIGEQRILHASVWAAASIQFFFSLFSESTSVTHDASLSPNLLWCATAIIPLMAYLIVTSLAYARQRKKLATVRARPLLYLRVFGSTKRSGRFFDLLRARWRFHGSMRLIAARDVADRLLTPGMFRGFVMGRLREFFLADPTQAVERASAIAANQQRDPDGSFRTTVLLCNSSTWREVVTALMPDSHAVVMDLRGFSRSNNGCRFELQTLLDHVNVDRIFLMVDTGIGNDSTDVSFLREVLQDGWRQLNNNSPNLTGTRACIRMLDIRGGDHRGVSWLIEHMNNLDNLE